MAEDQPSVAAEDLPEMVAGEVDPAESHWVLVPEGQIRAVLQIVPGEGRAAAEETVLLAVENLVVGIVLTIRYVQRGI